MGLGAEESGSPHGGAGVCRAGRALRSARVFPRPALFSPRLNLLALVLLSQHG